MPGARSSRIAIVVGCGSRPKTTAGVSSGSCVLVDLLLPRSARVRDRRARWLGRRRARRRLPGWRGRSAARAPHGSGRRGSCRSPRRAARRRRADRQRVLLADVADVERMLDPAGVAADPLLLERGVRLLLQAREACRRGRRGRVARGSEVGAPRVLADLRLGIPQAENAPGKRGTITSPISSSCARKTACIGPAPPKATSA